MMFPWPGSWLQCLDGPVPGSESASPGAVLSHSSAPLLSLLHSQNWPRRRIVLRSPSHALIPSLMSSAVMMMVSGDDLPCVSPVAPGDLISQPGPDADSFIKCWRAGGVLRPGGSVTTRGEQQTAGRHQSPPQDPPAKR